MTLDDGRAPTTVAPGGRGDPRRAVLAALMMTLALAALDATVVTTAVPSVVRDLGGFSLFPWLFSVYLLTQAVTVPIYGRMADIFGRRPILFTGIALFLTGSVLCGVAWNMESLIAFRGLQGLGAGCIIPIVQTVVGDLYSVKERARITGYTASVWGVASVLGPLLGGVFSQYVSWRWIFYINIPIGIVAIQLLRRHLHESVERREHSVDYLGAVVLTLGVAGLIFGLLEGGTEWPWSSAEEIVIFGVGAALIVAFGIIERHVAEPMIPPWVVSRRVLVSGNLANVAIGAIQLGLTSYIPTWAQGVRHVDPLVSGLTVASITIGWPLSASFAGKVYLRFGFRTTAMAGGALCLAGNALFILLGPTTPIPVVAVYGFLTGVGLGLASTPVLVGSQSLVGWERRGVVTASNLFARSIGSAVGIAILGSVANSRLASWLANAPRPIAVQLPHGVNVASKVLGGGSVALPTKVAAYVRLGLFHATHDVFVGIVLVGLFGLVAVACIPRHLAPLVFDGDVPPTPTVEEDEPGVEPLAQGLH